MPILMPGQWEYIENEPSDCKDPSLRELERRYKFEILTTPLIEKLSRTAGEKLKARFVSVKEVVKHMPVEQREIPTNIIGAIIIDSGTKEEINEGVGSFWLTNNTLDPIIADHEATSDLQVKNRNGEIINIGSKRQKRTRYG